MGKKKKLKEENAELEKEKSAGSEKPKKDKTEKPKNDKAEKPKKEKAGKSRKEKAKEKIKDKSKDKSKDKTKDKTGNKTGDTKKDGKSKKDQSSSVLQKRKPETRIPAVQDGVISADEAASVFRALGDEVRMQILRLLEERELCASELLQSVSIVQSTLSHHMKILTESGIVVCRREGKKAIYSISEEKMAQAAVFLKCYRTLNAQDDK